jgi:hypothetical protein
MISVIERLYPDTNDTAVVLQGSGISRVMSIGSNWSRIRIGVRFTINLLGYTGRQGGIPIFGFGVCANGGYETFGARNVSHFVGMTTNRANVLPTVSGSGHHLNESGDFSVRRKVGTAITGTVGASSSITSGIGAHPGVARCCLYLELLKGSPNYTNWTAYPASVASSGVDTTLEEFYIGLETATLNLPTLAPFSTYQGRLNSALAVDESAGVLDSVWVDWNLTAWAAEVSQVAVYRVS